MQKRKKLSPAHSVLEAQSLNLQRHSEADWAACLLAATSCQSVWILLTLFSWSSEEAGELKDRDLRTLYEQPAIQNKKKQPAGPWGKAPIRILFYHKSHNWIIHVWQLYSISYLIHSRTWVWKQVFEVWRNVGQWLERQVNKSDVGVTRLDYKWQLILIVS